MTEREIDNVYDEDIVGEPSERIMSEVIDPTSTFLMVQGNQMIHVACVLMMLIKVLPEIKDGVECF
jgi:hypothetical protein